MFIYTLFVRVGMHVYDVRVCMRGGGAWEIPTCDVGSDPGSCMIVAPSYICAHPRARSHTCQVRGFEDGLSIVSATRV